MAAVCALNNIYKINYENFKNSKFSKNIKSNK